MHGVKQRIALLCILLLLAPTGSFAADNSSSPPAVNPTTAATASDLGTLTEPPHGILGRVDHPYRPPAVPDPNLVNSEHLSSLLRAGNLYLSLRDTLALALENNIDLEIQRYVPRMAEAEVLRTRAGGYAPTTVGTSVLPGPASVGGIAPNSGLQAYQVAGLTQIGPIAPGLDPVLVGSANWAHSTAPQSNTVTTGTSALIQRQDTNALSVQQYFLTGTQVSLGLNDSTVFTNSNHSAISPGTTSGLNLTVSQHLLQGFGPGLNGRQIHIAKNNREVSDLTFKAQVITTIVAVAALYWDLVTFNENVKVKRDAMAASQRLLEDNRKQVEVGTMAPISVVQAEAEIASDQQALVVAETQVLQQETILKNALSRTGVLDPLVANAHIIPTDTITIPDQEAIAPIQDAMATAESSRPELVQYRILVENQRIAVQGTRNELLPTLDLVGSLQNNGLAGQVNPLFVGSVPAVFTGGYGTVLSQLFARHFPNYALGFNLNVPIHNRAAQSDYINADLTLRQQQLGVRRMENQIRVEVQNAAIGLQQARAQYQAAAKQRVLEEQTVDAEQKKLAAGVSTTYNVILTQRDLVTAQSNEVAARSVYAKARVEMDRVTGQTLYDNNISMDEAVKGQVSRPLGATPAASPAPRP
jgi:outer membrane protein TolC